MPKVLSEKQVDRFHREGFITPIPVLSEDEVAKYRAHLEAFEAKFPDDRRKLKSKSTRSFSTVVEVFFADTLFGDYHAHAFVSDHTPRPAFRYSFPPTRAR